MYYIYILIFVIILINNHSLSSSCMMRADGRVDFDSRALGLQAGGCRSRWRHGGRQAPLSNLIEERRRPHWRVCCGTEAGSASWYTCTPQMNTSARAYARAHAHMHATYMAWWAASGAIKSHWRALPAIDAFVVRPKQYLSQCMHARTRAHALSAAGPTDVYVVCPKQYCTYSFFQCA